MENQKKTVQVRRKDEEVKRVKRVNETLKVLVKQSVGESKPTLTGTKHGPHKKSFNATNSM